MLFIDVLLVLIVAPLVFNNVDLGVVTSVEIFDTVVLFGSIADEFVLGISVVRTFFVVFSIVVGLVVVVTDLFVVEMLFSSVEDEIVVV